MSTNTSFTDIDDKVQRLRKKQAEWTQLSFAEKHELLHKIGKNVEKYGQEWVDAGVAAKKLDPKLASDEWSSVFPTARLVRLLKETYEPAVKAEKHGQPITFLAPPSVKDHGNQKLVRIFPSTSSEGMMFPDLTVDMYLEPGTNATQGTEVLDAKTKGVGAVSLVLGAGNQSSIPFMDALYKLFNQNQVVIMKHNPVCEWLYDVMDKIFEPLIALDYFHHVRGGAEEGKYLVDLCDNVHITGSDKTHDAIVWGKADKKTASKPQFEKEITSELGCVSPFIIACDTLSNKELDYVAEHIVGAVINNNSFNCNAAKILVLRKNWHQRDVLMTRVKALLGKQERRYAYYPGAEQRYSAFQKQYPQAEQVGATTEEDKKLPWLVIEDVPGQEGEYALCNEPFCPVLSTIIVDSNDVPTFLKDAVDLVNEKVWGNLTMSLFVDPTSEAKYKQQVEQAIDDLKYGGVAYNVWSGVLYALGSPTWGAYPGNDVRDIQSGTGVVHNSFLLDHPQKCVVRSPFMLMMGARYTYFPSNKTAVPFLKEMTSYETSPSVWGFAKTMWQSIWG